MTSPSVSMAIAPLTLLAYTVTYMIGGTIFAHYHRKGCDPLRTDLVRRVDQVVTANDKLYI